MKFTGRFIFWKFFLFFFLGRWSMIWPNSNFKAILKIFLRPESLIIQRSDFFRLVIPLTALFSVVCTHVFFWKDGSLRVERIADQHEPWSIDVSLSTCGVQDDCPLVQCMTEQTGKYSRQGGKEEASDVKKHQGPGRRVPRLVMKWTGRSTCLHKGVMDGIYPYYLFFPVP